MKERGILFSAPMVRALLAGTKLQTRRIAPIAVLTLTPRGEGCTTWHVKFSKAVKGSLATYSGGRFTDSDARRIIASQYNPYGVPGDRLWVRESWRTVAEADGLPPRELDGAYRFWYEADAPHQPGYGKLRPSMFMPRCASRITLEIADVRVERLQSISEADALAEGIVPTHGGYGLPAGEHFHAADPRQSYLSLWEAINGPGSVEANPWVWAVSFVSVDPVAQKPIGSSGASVDPIAAKRTQP